MGARSVDRKWFKARLEAVELSQRQLAFKLGIDPSAMARLLKGERALGTGEAVKVAGLLGCSLEDVLLAAGVDVAAATGGVGDVKIVGVVGEGFSVAWGRPKTGPKLAPALVGLGVGVAVEALRIETAGTRFDSMDGGLVYFARGEGVDPGAVGKLAVVEIASGGAGSKAKGLAVVRTLKKGYSRGRWNLFSISGELMESDVEVSGARIVVLLKL